MRPNGTANITLLLVEDHPLLLRGLVSFIESEAPDMAIVGRASTADEACALSMQLAPDVVLLGLELGGVSDLPVISRLVKDGRPRVLVYTTARSAAVRREAVMLGARGVIEKASDPLLILKAIRQIMAGEIWLDRKSVGEVMATLLRGVRGASTEDPRVARLTRRELQIIAAMHANLGRPAKSVAAAFEISEHTLRNHLTAVYKKLGVGSRLELSALAEKIGLVKPVSRP